MGSAVLEPLSPHASAEELRASWQGRTIEAAHGMTGAVLLSILSHNFDDALPFLLRAVFPGFYSISAPFLCSAGKVAKSGCVVADVIDEGGDKLLHQWLYASETDLRDDFRRLADRLKLSDHDRVQLFLAIKQWVVCDYRMDPTMDPKDPDAKRLRH